MRAPRMSGSQKESSTEDEEDWEKASLGSAFDDWSQDEWAVVGNSHRSLSASPSGWVHVADIAEVMLGHAGQPSGRNAAQAKTFAERMCAGPFASTGRSHLSKHRGTTKKKPSLMLSSHSEERPQAVDHLVAE
ncbi:hypothetical protein AB1Y20_008901 [Prymnesium parvum]|uniref:Myb-like domain-containing protein n=1 Tax=Prymnesium parvum TaxID=97485 RepID=A0AB34JZW5_PRYPA